jgi:hypothetical protein
MCLRFKLVISHAIAFTMSFTEFVAFHIADQAGKKRSESMGTRRDTVDLIATSNEQYLGNMDPAGMEKSLASLGKDADIVSIETEDSSSVTVAPYESKESPPVLYAREANIERLLVISGVIVIIVLLTLMTVLASRSTAPVKHLLRIVGDMAEGDLTADYSKTISSSLTEIIAKIHDGSSIAAESSRLTCVLDAGMAECKTEEAPLAYPGSPSGESISWGRS